MPSRAAREPAEGGPVAEPGGEAALPPGGRAGVEFRRGVDGGGERAAGLEAAEEFEGGGIEALEVGAIVVAVDGEEDVLAGGIRAGFAAMFAGSRDRVACDFVDGFAAARGEAAVEREVKLEKSDVWLEAQAEG